MRLRSSDTDPPRLTRCSAMVGVRLTRRGRVHARRLLLDPEGVLTFYFRSCDGAKIYYLMTADQREQRAFDALEDVPEFEYDVHIP